MDKKERLLALIGYYGDNNNSQFARFLGITPQGVSSWLSRNTFDIDLVYAKCVDLSSHWLLTGEGAMLLKKNDNLDVEVDINSEKKYTPKYIPKYTPNDNFPQKINIAKEVHQGGIPLLPVEAAAGLLSGAGVQIMEYECEQYVIPSFKDAEFMIRINGNSMEPKYFSGDVVACQRLPMGTFFQWNCVYVIDSEQGILIKRIKKGPDKDHIILVSDNVAYEPFELHISQLNGLGRVIGLVRLES